MALDDFVISKLDGIRRSFNEMTERLADPDVISNPNLSREVSEVGWLNPLPCRWIMPTGRR